VRELQHLYLRKNKTTQRLSARTQEHAKHFQKSQLNAPRGPTARRYRNEGP